MVGSDRRYEPADTKPPPPPRPLPDGVTGTAGGGVLLLVGGIFVAISLVFVVVGLVIVAAGNREGWFFTLFPLIHLTVGGALAGYAISTRRRRRDLYCNGTVALGTISGVGYDRSVRVNGANPFELVWSYEVDGHHYHDKHASFDAATFDYAVGDRLWILYDPDDPEQSVEWPPLR